MVLRDKRLWFGLVLALVIGVVSYSVVSGIGKDKPGTDVAQQLAITPSDGGTPSATPDPTGSSTVPPGDVLVPDLVGQRLTDAKAALAGKGFTTVKAADASSQNRLILDDQNWVVEEQHPGAGVAVDPHAQITLNVRKPTDAHSPSRTDFGVVPNVVCANLQDAQNALRLSGFLLLTSTDGTGKGRVALVDRNWVVTRQSAAANSSPGLTTHITLTVVKYGEPTGNPTCQS
jgi:hypothetical protein